MASEQLHTDGRAHQTDIEHRGHYCGGLVAAECFWNFERTPEDSGREALMQGVYVTAFSCLGHRSAHG